MFRTVIDCCAPPSWTYFPASTRNEEGLSKTGKLTITIWIILEFIYLAKCFARLLYRPGLMFLDLGKSFIHNNSKAFGWLASLRRISSVGSAFFNLRWFKLADICTQV